MGTVGVQGDRRLGLRGDVYACDCQPVIATLRAQTARASFDHLVRCAGPVKSTVPHDHDAGGVGGGAEGSVSGVKFGVLRPDVERESVLRADLGRNSLGDLGAAAGVADLDDVLAAAGAEWPGDDLDLGVVPESIKLSLRDIGWESSCGGDCLCALAGSNQ